MLTSILPSVPKAEIQDFTSTKSKFKTPYTLETVLGEDPPLEDLMMFTANRGIDYENLSDKSKEMWRNSWRDNRILCGYLVSAVVFPAYLKRRIKLREAETHWVNIDDRTLKGKSKLENRRIALKLVESMTASSCFRGTSEIIHPTVQVREFLGLSTNDEGVVFFKQRDFTRTSTNSSAHASCAAILSHLWFVTTILGRPCSLDSVVVPIRGEEMSRLEYLGICGKVTAFPTDWKSDVFPRLPGYSHENMAGLFLERLTSDSYVDVYPSDAFLLYKMRNSGTRVSMGAKSSAHNLAMVPCFDTLLTKTDSCGLDALDITAICLEFGQEAANRVRVTESVKVFSTSMTRKMDEAIKLFSDNHLLLRRSVNNRLKINQAQDPGGIKKKLAGGRLLDPRVKENVDLVKNMIGSISERTWIPIKQVIFKLVESIHPDMDEEVMCETFLSVKDEDFRRKASKLGVTTADVSNVCFLLCLTMSFQRSQVLRDSLVREYIPTRDGIGYTLSIERALKTSGSDNNGYTPVREFELSPSQSMMVHLIKLAGDRRGGMRLLINERGGDMTQNNLGSRYRTIGQKYLGISNLSPHAMRTFFASHVIDSGKVEQRDLNELSSFLMVSAKTLSTAYVASSTNTEAHKIGKRVFENLTDPESRKKPSFDTESRPAGKKLGQSRDVYKEDILKSIERYKSIKECFMALVEQRRNGFLQKKDGWFEYNKTYFDDTDWKFFSRFVQSRII